MNDLYVSEYERYATYNFQPLNAFDQLAERISSDSDQGPRVIVLAGPRGIGRKYILQAAAFTAGQRGISVRYARVDLAGFEPDHAATETDAIATGIPATTMAEYVAHQLDEYCPADKQSFLGTLERLKIDLKLAPIASWFACSASMSISLIGPPKRRAQFLAETLSAPRSEPKEALHQSILRLAGDAALVLHVVDYDSLDAALQRWLFDYLRTTPRLMLAISADPGRPPEYRYWRDEILRVELAPLDAAELKRVLKHRFNTDGLPLELVDALVRYSQGVPSLIAAKLRECVRSDLIRGDPVGGWNSVDTPAALRALAGTFSDQFYEPIDQLRSHLPPAEFDTLERFLQLAALCGGTIPTYHVTDFLGIAHDGRDELIDLIDRELTDAAEQPVLRDHGFAHPGFPGIPVYSFAHPFVARAVLDRLDAASQRRLATRLLNFLDERVKIATRGVARLFLNLAEAADRTEAAAELRERLRWWVAREAAGELEGILIADLADHRLSPDALWQAVVDPRSPAPPYRRLAMLNAYERQPGGMRFGIRDDFCMARAEALYALGRYGDAESPCREAAAIRIRQYGEDDRSTLRARVLLGHILQELGQYPEAEATLRDVLKRHQCSYSSDDPHVGTLHSNLAMIQQDQGDLGAARANMEKAIAIDRRHFAEDHPTLATSYSNLATIQQAQGDLGAARANMEKAVGIFEKQLGTEHPNLAGVCSNLATIQHAQGDLGAARANLEKAVAIQRRHFAEDHPNLATLYHNLAGIAADERSFDEAVRLEGQALAILLKQFSDGHPHVRSSRECLERYRALAGGTGR